MEQPPTSNAEAKEALSPPGAAINTVDTCTATDNSETPPKEITQIKKKQKKRKQKGE